MSKRGDVSPEGSEREVAEPGERLREHSLAICAAPESAAATVGNIAIPVCFFLSFPFPRLD